MKDRVDIPPDLVIIPSDPSSPSAGVEVVGSLEAGVASLAVVAWSAILREFKLANERYEGG